MNKDTIEISREEHITGYGEFSCPREDDTEILDKLIEWSRNSKKHIYKHKIRRVEENIGKSGKIHKFRHPDCPPADIPYCELVYYLDIYYQ